MNAIHIVHEAIKAHGGMDYWSSLEAIDAEISASGFLFTANRRPVLFDDRKLLSKVPELHVWF